MGCFATARIVTTDEHLPANRGCFQKGRSGNPGGRPKKIQANNGSAFAIILDKTLTLSRDGVSREIALEEALQHRTYQDALAGKRLAVREVLRWVEKRERWLAKKRPANTPKITSEVRIKDPDNADAALILLGIANHDPRRVEYQKERSQLLLEPWAVAAALRRRRGTKALSNKEISEIRRCTRDSGSLKLPVGLDE